MSVDNLPYVKPPDFAEVCDPRRPILSHAWQATGPHRAAAHSHPRAHIIQPVVGAYWVMTPEGTWLVPSRQAIWIPPWVHHEVYSHGSVSARMVFVDPAYTGSLPPRCVAVNVSPLLAELLARAVRYGNDYSSDGPAARLARVMLDELATMELAPFLLPVSKEPRLARVMERLVKLPGSQLRVHVPQQSGRFTRVVSREKGHLRAATSARCRPGGVWSGVARGVRPQQGRRRSCNVDGRPFVRV